MKDAYVIPVEIIESVLDGIDAIQVQADCLLKICHKRAWISAAEARSIAYRIKSLSRYEYEELADSIAEYIQITAEGLKLLEAPPETE